MIHRTFLRAAGYSILAITTVATMTTPASAATDQHRLICTELGITPEAMAVFGMNSVQTNNTFDRIDELGAEIASLRSLQSQQRTKTLDFKQAQKDVRVAMTQADAQRINAEIDQLKLDRAALSVSIEAKQDEIRLAILPAGLDLLLVERVCEPVGMAAFVPVEFRVVNLIASDYQDLLPALTAEKKALASGESLDMDTQLTLGRYRHLPAVETARSNMLYNLDAVRGAFND